MIAALSDVGLDWPLLQERTSRTRWQWLKRHCGKRWNFKRQTAKSSENRWKVDQRNSEIGRINMNQPLKQQHLDWSWPLNNWNHAKSSYMGTTSRLWSWSLHMTLGFRETAVNSGHCGFAFGALKVHRMAWKLICSLKIAVEWWHSELMIIATMPFE